jgi:hypothetical protein
MNIKIFVACFLLGRAKDLSAPLYINMYDISTNVTHFTSTFGYKSKFTLYCGLSGLWYLLVSYVRHPVPKNHKLNIHLCEYPNFINKMKSLT